MIKALLLIFDPMATWEGIFRSRRSMGFILGLYLVPLLLLTSAGEGYGLVHWGKSQNEFGGVKKFPVGEAVVVEATQYLLSLFVVFAGARMLKSIGETFHGRHSYSQAFTVVAYGLSPLFLLRLVDTFPGVSPWVAWSIGICLSVGALYSGVPRIMEPDPSHAFGLFLMSAMLLTLITGLMRYVTAEYLGGKFPILQGFIADIAARLPF